MITYRLSRLSDGRVMFAPGTNEPSHTFSDATAARWFVKGWHYAKYPRATEGFKVEID